MNNHFASASLFLFTATAFGQAPAQHRTIVWTGLQEIVPTEEVRISFLTFENASCDAENQFAPIYFERFRIPEKQDAEATLTNLVFEALPPGETPVARQWDGITGEIVVRQSIGFERTIPYLLLHFIPLRINPATQQYERLISFDIQVVTSAPAGKAAPVVRTYANNSVLSSGQWYKVGVKENGIYKLDYAAMQSLGINPAATDPRNIRVYGNGGGMLPHANADFRHDDLVENAIEVVGESDGSFDPGDYVLFYGQSPHKWTYAPASKAYSHERHLYDDYTYYFITTDLGPGKRISSQSSSAQAPTHTVTVFDDFAFHEYDAVNLIKSGRQWYGEAFDIVTSYDFAFSFPNVDLSSPVFLKADAAARAVGVNSAFTVSITGQGYSMPVSINPITGSYTADFAAAGSNNMTFYTNASSISVNVQYNKPIVSAAGWLNYLALNARRNLTMTGDQMPFRDAVTAAPGNVAEYRLASSSSGLKIWEITNPLTPQNQEGAVNAGVFSFVQPADSIRDFIAFTGNSYLAPQAFGPIANQNLHSAGLADRIDMIVVTHPDFLTEAQRLADYRGSHDGLKVFTATTTQVYNEFASGARDVTAIRDFVKMIFDRAPGPDDLPRYLLLFGDGSYDNKNRLANNTNFIPTYQSANSLSPTASYVSDDYFGLLDDTEGKWDPSGADLVDIGIGRLPVKSPAEAKVAVDKIMHYDGTQTFGDWRNVICFVADDEDGNLHVSQANQLATYVDTTHCPYNIDKIYFDAYQQETSSGGQRYPGVKDAINRRVQNGALIINYTGHGGEAGWAQERVLDVPDINGYTNYDRMTVFFTATCEFSRYDDPGRVSAGEYAFLNPGGASIALLSTVRLVFAVPNFLLNQKFFFNVFSETGGEMPRLGDILLRTKVASGPAVNNRNFTLLGDPSLRLAYPQFDVVTTGIPDTLRALQKVTVTGYVADETGQKSTGFNGIIYPSVYDKPATVKTLANDGGGVFSFTLQKNLIYKGKASVTNGEFSFTFVTPRDIAYQFGKGKISYYADNGAVDAHGCFRDFIIGGASGNIAPDEAGPEISLFMNDDRFVFGGITDEDPVMLAYVSDSNGINTVGNGIGHDIVATLDANTEKAIALNDYYEADLDSYRSGKVEYPFSSLSEGRHSLALKVWDVHNNSAEAYTEFVVAKSAEIALDHVLNYPNPFTTNTAFFFEHNQPGTPLEVQVQIFTVSGKLLKTISSYMTTDGFRSDPIPWNGLDDFGDKIGRGVYVYRMKVHSPAGTTADKYEKLVILN